MRFFWPNPITSQALTASGWTPGRRIDITDWTARLESEGFHVSPAAATILETFGGLAIQPPHLATALWSADSLFFDPLDVANGMYDRYADFESTLGHRMTPLAANASSTTFLLILDDGRVVSDGILALHLLAPTFPQALDLLIRRHRTPDLLLTYNRPTPVVQSSNSLQVC
ncbi:SUKH-3 domain-containing protein [Nocardia sp. CDC160]|uniref:SUKH-3 domain-containing protein n=1 Tax=Nocardia sp. CDC160 TaxID=3112166 RepID=UPI002DBE6230|nr:SUKH-3 domain-containing protein [Nocardia sp. CDC160]MEC3920197.1 SUKH-3 domain-containing protein [Nocardia sp. CDC160]